MINDESPDNSVKIAEEFSKKDKRFILYNKKNGGLSDARNYGIERARGEFISFIDSDDHVHKDFLKDLYLCCVKNNADMAYCKFMYSYFNTGLKFPRPSKARSGVVKKEAALRNLIRDDVYQSYAWNKLYRRSLFTDSGIRYPYMYFEDVATSSRLLYQANKLAVCGKHLYYYEKRFGSIVGTMNCEKINDYWRSVLSDRNYFQSIGEYKTYQDAILRLAKKVRYVNVYSIVRQHLLHMDFRKIKYNLDTNKEIYEFIVSDRYQVSEESVPEIPYKLLQPGHKKKEKRDKKFPF